MLKQPKPQSESQRRRLEIQMRHLKREREEREALTFPPLATPEPGLPLALICDIDGTLANRGERGVYDFDKSIDDTVDLRTKFILKIIEDQNRWQNSEVPKMEIFLITGREDRWKMVTNQWLNRHDIPYDHMYMRRTADKRPSFIVKEEIWSAEVRGKFNVFMAFEDREQDIGMWRSHGIYVFKPDSPRSSSTVDNT